MILLETFYEILQWYIYAHRCRYICIYTYMYNRRMQACYIIRYKVHSYKLYSARIFIHTYITQQVIKQSTKKKGTCRTKNLSTHMFPTIVPNEISARYSCSPNKRLIVSSFFLPVIITTMKHLIESLLVTFSPSTIFEQQAKCR